MNQTQIHIQDLIIKHVLIKTQPSPEYYQVIDNNGSWIFDFRKGFLNPEVLDVFSKYFWDTYEKEYPFQVGGIESGAIPFITGIILEWLKRWKKVNGFYVRKTRKEKGLGNMIEWNLTEEKIIIVDDVLNGWQSIFTVYKALASINKNIFKSFVFVNFWNPIGQSVIKENFINFNYLFTLSDFWLSDYTQWGFANQPIIYPKFKKLFELPCQNLFLDTPKSNPILLWNQIFLTGEWWDFFSVNKDTGDIIWKTLLPKTFGHKNILSSPLRIENEIVFGNYDGNIYFLDIQSWKINFVLETMADFIGSSPCYHSGKNILFIGCEHACATSKWSLIAFDIKLKQILWEKSFADFVHASPAVSVSRNIVICGGNDGKIIWVDVMGNIFFEHQLKAPIKWSFVFSVDEKYVFFWTHDFHFYKINLENWEIDFSFPTENIIYTTPLTREENIFFWSTDKKFYHLLSNGEMIKKIKTNGKIFGQPIAIENNWVIFSSNDGFIYFYDFVMKKIVWSIFHGEKINNKLIFENGYLYVLDHVWGLYKYNITQFL